MSDVNSVWNFISTKIKCLRNKHIPVIYVSATKNKKSTTIEDSLLHLTREKRYYYKKYKKFRNQSNYLLYCIARARVHSHIRNSKRQKEVKIAKNIKSNAKTFYQYISSKSCKKDKIPDLIKADGTKTKNDEEKSRELNNFFSSVFTTENNDEFPYMQDKVNEDKHIHQAISNHNKTRNGKFAQRS